MIRKITPDAFDYYVALGPERSYRGVAKHFEVSKRAVTDHAGKEKWAQRLKEIEARARAESDKRLVETLEEIQSRHIKMARAMAARALKAIMEYPLTSGMEGIRAGEIAVKLERIIMGEASERTEMTVAETTKREIQSLLRVETVEEEDGEEVGDAGGDDEAT